MNQVMNILYSTDGSPAALAAADVLLKLALPPNTRVLLATVIREPYVPESPHHLAWNRLMEEMDLRELEMANDLLAQAKGFLIAKNLAASGVSLETLILTGNVPQAIVNAARTLDVDLIVLGSRGLSGVLSVLLGSVARRVAEVAPCSVLVARPTARGLQRALLAIDGSSHSQEAVRVLTEFPLPTEAEVSVLSVAQPIRLPLTKLVSTVRQNVRKNIDEIERAELDIAKQLAEEAKECFQASGRIAQALAVKGDPAQTIVRVAGEMNSDLVVVGSRGLTGAKAFLVGSVAQKVLESAPCSVLVARSRIESAGEHSQD